MAAHLPNRQARATVPVESPSPRATGAGILYLWFPDAALRASALRVLREARRKVELSDSCLRVAMRQGELDPCLLELGAGVGASGTRRARALFVPGQQVPCLDDFGRIASLHELHVLAQTGWLLDQLENATPFPFPLRLGSKLLLFPAAPVLPSARLTSVVVFAPRSRK